MTTVLHAWLRLNYNDPLHAFFFLFNYTPTNLKLSSVLQNDATKLCTHIHVHMAYVYNIYVLYMCGHTYIYTRLYTSHAYIAHIYVTHIYIYTYVCTYIHTHVCTYIRARQKRYSRLKWMFTDRQTGFNSSQGNDCSLRHHSHSGSSDNPVL
jgi:hypothetical protein